MSKKKNPNRAGFLNTVDIIKNAENDVDKVLQAARLERHESRVEPLKASDIMKLALIIGFMLICCTALVLGFLCGYFIPALLGVGLIILLGGAFAACM